MKSMPVNRFLHSPVITLYINSNSSTCFLGKKKWKKTCCLPSFVIFLFILSCVVSAIALLAIFNVESANMTVNVILITVTCIVGLAFFLNCRTWWQVMDSVLNSQRKRLHNAASKLHKLKSEGFMKVSIYMNWPLKGVKQTPKHGALLSWGIISLTRPSLTTGE